MIILGIETSCDETAVSVVEAEGDLENPSFKVVGSALESQVKIHKQYGGVYPALAKREHLKNLPIVYRQAIEKAGISESKIQMIAVTVGPGLEPALWTGINFAKSLAEKLGVKALPTNHMLGHIASVLINKPENTRVEFPAMALLISGGHTELIYLKSWREVRTIGETQDDAVGEAFDKVARMLGLSYPGGPEISRLAEQARNLQLSIFNFQSPKFPRPMIHSKDFNFSFSGLKTAVLYYLRKLTSPPNPLPLSRGGGKKKTKFSSGGEVVAQEIKLAVAREFEDAVIETLLSKTMSAIQKYSPKTLIIGGGVIANKALRQNFSALNKAYPELKILIPDKPLATDNAIMIAAAGFIDLLRESVEKELKANGNLKTS